jgi:glycosyltransferase involved in cell wall biosynthesis
VSKGLPRVSVAIPTWRGEATLGAAIESVLAQDFGDFELIVVDDNSADGTRDLVEGFRDERLRYLRNPTNLGPEGNWNRCQELAQGEYFKLLPHDDVLHRKCLARQVAVLDADRDERIALVFCPRDVLGPDGRVLMQRRYPGGASGRLAAREVLAACVRRGTNLIGEPGGVLWRRSLGCRVGRFDATDPYVIDLDYWARLLGHGDAYCCDEPLVGFRVSGGSWSVAIGSGQSADFRRFVRRLSARGLLRPGPLDRMLGLVTPTLNNWARMMFYRLYR